MMFALTDFIVYLPQSLALLLNKMEVLLPASYCEWFLIRKWNAKSAGILATEKDIE